MTGSGGTPTQPRPGGAPAALEMALLEQFDEDDVVSIFGHLVEAIDKVGDQCDK